MSGPEVIAQIACAKRDNARELYLSYFNIALLPDNLYEVLSLERLYAISNEITMISAGISCLTSLRILDLRCNRLTSLPSEIGGLISLKELHVSNNRLVYLPPDIGNLSQLELLDLRHNDLSSLPDEFAQLVKLRTLNLEANQLGDIPQKIVDSGAAAVVSYLHKSAETPKSNHAPSPNYPQSPFGGFMSADSYPGSPASLLRHSHSQHYVSRHNRSVSGFSGGYSSPTLRTVGIPPRSPTVTSTSQSSPRGPTTDSTSTSPGLSPRDSDPIDSQPPRHTQTPPRKLFVDTSRVEPIAEAVIVSSPPYQKLSEETRTLRMRNRELEDALAAQRTVADNAVQDFKQAKVHGAALQHFLDQERMASSRLQQQVISLQHQVEVWVRRKTDSHIQQMEQEAQKSLRAQLEQMRQAFALQQHSNEAIAVGEVRPASGETTANSADSDAITANFSITQSSIPSDSQRSLLERRNTPSRQSSASPIRASPSPNKVMFNSAPVTTPPHVGTPTTASAAAPAAIMRAVSPGAQSTTPVGGTVSPANLSRHGSQLSRNSSAGLMSAASSGQRKMILGSLQSILDRMKRPTELKKFPYRPNPKENGGRARKFRLSDDGSTILWGSSRREKFDRQLALTQVRCVIYGPYTNAFRSQEMKKISGHARCFSLVFGSRTLDLQAHSDMDAMAWVMGLQYLCRQQEHAPLHPVYTSGRILFKRLRLRVAEQKQHGGLDIVMRTRYAISTAQQMIQSAPARLTMQVRRRSYVSNDSESSALQPGGTPRKPGAHMLRPPLPTSSARARSESAGDESGLLNVSDTRHSYNSSGGEGTPSRRLSHSSATGMVLSGRHTPIGDDDGLRTNASSTSPLPHDPDALGLLRVVGHVSDAATSPIVNPADASPLARPLALRASPSTSARSSLQMQASPRERSQTVTSASPRSHGEAPSPSSRSHAASPLLMLNDDELPASRQSLQRPQSSRRDSTASAGQAPDMGLLLHMLQAHDQMVASGVSPAQAVKNLLGDGITPPVPLLNLPVFKRQSETEVSRPQHTPRTRERVMLEQVAQQFLGEVKQGATFIKYPFHGGEPELRRFEVDMKAHELRWGRPDRRKLNSVVRFEEVRYMVFGALTKTLRGRKGSKFGMWSWRCFSLVLKDRTLDVQAHTDEQAQKWFLALQYLIDDALRQKGIDMERPIMSRARFIFKRAKLKIEAQAKQQGGGWAKTFIEALLRRTEEHRHEEEQKEHLAKEQVQRQQDLAAAIALAMQTQTAPPPVQTPIRPSTHTGSLAPASAATLAPAPTMDRRRSIVSTGSHGGAPPQRRRPMTMVFSMPTDHIPIPRSTRRPSFFAAS